MSDTIIDAPSDVPQPMQSLQPISGSALRHTWERWQVEDGDVAQAAELNPTIAPLLPFMLSLARLAATKDAQRAET